MAVITLGSYSAVDTGSITPITIPVDELPIEQVIILRNPLLIRQSSTSGSSDSFWLRNDSGYLKPATTTDKLVINGSSFVAGEKLRVVGDINATSFRIGAGISIAASSNNLTFTDPTSGTHTLAELLAGTSSISASNVTVADSHNVFVGTNVEDVLYELYVRINSSLHTHNNFSLLETYTQTEVNLADAVTKKHAAVTIGTANGLSLSDQEISLGLATASLNGALSGTDWSAFNAKLDPTTTLTQIKDLTLSQGSLIVGTGAGTASMLLSGTQGQVLKISTLGDIEWGTATVGDTAFEVRKYPDDSYFTSITNQLGDITNANYPTVIDLNNKSLKEILQEILFPMPLIPNFVNPTESVSSITKGTSANFNGLYVIKGSTSTITLDGQLNSSIGPGGNAYAVTYGAEYYQQDSVSFTNGSSVTFTANTTFTILQAWVANPLEQVNLGGGTIVLASGYLGYPSDPANRIATVNQSYTVVDPTYYGAFTAGTSTFPSAPTNSEITTDCTKLISVEPSTLTLAITPYSGAVDTHKYIVVFYPASYGVLTRIDYVEGGNTNVIGSFTGPSTVTYTRPDSTTVNYYLYYALNSYANTIGTITYTVRF